MGSNLWSWHLAQPNVMPRNTEPRVRDVVQRVLPALAQILRVVLLGVVSVEAGGDARVEIAGPQFVAGDLLAHEAIVRLVGIEARMT